MPQNETKTQKKPEDFIIEANETGEKRTAFVAGFGCQLFMEWWKAHLADNTELPSELERVKVMKECIRTADLCREEVNAYQIDQTEAHHNEVVERAARSGLKVPTWGEVKDHFPNGFQPGAMRHG